MGDRPTERQRRDHFNDQAEDIATTHALMLCLAAVTKREGDMREAKRLLCGAIIRAMCDAYEAGSAGRSAISQNKGGEDAS